MMDDLEMDNKDRNKILTNVKGVNLAKRQIYLEFSEFSPAQIKKIEEIFNMYDSNKDGYLCKNELKHMMIKRRVPWTENSINQLIDDVDNDHDGKLTFREFLMTNRKTLEYVQRTLAKQEKVDFSQVGIKGVKEFFEAKAKFLK
ncbi:EF-hand domain-containing protein D2 homolog isoform X2 [Daktulosphaira vitifoliae]|uniref:EF-hand domain-containing protein D2 homolog isoform X2 n=1 Tax=Daktulosphaira vitifoliae TaxID=58002 RepID=UPI0021AABB8E|nr:EF-hand domain-containing protein D2 homolog isoform X2 [Daktulosphaira vitifoliae]